MARWALYQNWSLPDKAQCGIWHLKAICTILGSGGLCIGEQPILVGHDIVGYFNLSAVKSTSRNGRTVHELEYLHKTSVLYLEIAVI